MDVLTADQWSPYVVGAGIGVLSWLSFLISRQPISCSTAFARTSGMIEKRIRGAKVLEQQFYREVKPVIDWQWMLVLGIVIGSLLSSLLSGGFNWLWVPSVWATAFGPSVPWRLLAAAAGGIFIALGARWANGCTSGHGISGTLQLAVSGWISAICFFVSGIVVAHWLY